MSETKYELPTFLEGLCSRENYRHWLRWKANAHYKRDKKRLFPGATQTSWKEAIHNAVLRSGGKDEYTGHPLRWDLLRTYNNAKAKSGGVAYKKEFANLPSVDHFDPSKHSPDFRICAWAVNDSKSDLTIEEYLALCTTVLAYHSQHVQSRKDNSIKSS